MEPGRDAQVEVFLRQGGARTNAEIGQAIGASQPTVSRALAGLGDRVIRLGRGRASRYALVREVARAGHAWPLYRVDAQGRAAHLGTLSALFRDGFHFAASRPLPAFTREEFRDGLFPELPWFLDDQRPQGFLGRAFAQRIAADIGAPEDLQRWQSDDVVLALLTHGHDLPGDLVLGDAALQRALQQMLGFDHALPASERQVRYPERAEAALRGEDVGSSAGGEQPKFLATLREPAGVREVIVKFSDRRGTPAGQRWSDLLQCECIAANVLRAHGQAAARTDALEADGRVFLESTRFDRTADGGRHGFVTLAALDAAFHGHARIDWWRYADQLQGEGWIDADSAHRLRVLGWFGSLIGNSDMHLGNAGLILTDTRPLTLAPAYDMLPMMFRPASTGELVDREFKIVLPTPEQQADWREAAVAAEAFWAQVAVAEVVSEGFRAIAQDALAMVTRAMGRIGGRSAGKR